MTFWPALRRLLPLLAVVGLALAPVTASAAAVGMRAPTAMQDHPLAMADGGVEGMVSMAMDDMPCCTDEKAPAMPDCSKGCPLMALCLAKVASRVPSGIGLLARIAVVEGPTWGRRTSFASLAQAPPPEPPRS